MYDYILKFIIIGNSSVGKSNLLSMFTDKRFHSDHTMTIGVEFGTKIISSKNKKCKIQIWDTAGQEAFRSITRTYYRGTIGCLIVYDITNRSSFDSISFWIEDLKKNCDPSICIALVGNKMDLEHKRVVSTEEGKDLAERHNMIFFETSAKNGTNVDTCFYNIVDRISQMIEDKTIDLTTCKGCVDTSTITLKQDEGSSYWCSC